MYNLMMSLPAMADGSGLTSGMGYASKDKPTSNISLGQGFFITSDNDGVLIFNNNQRVFSKESTNESHFYSSDNNLNIPQDNRMKLWFAFGQPTIYSKFLGLGYDERATSNYDKGFDGETFNISRNDMFWLLEDKKLAIQALSNFDIEQELSLGVKIEDVGLFSFSLVDYINIPDDIIVYLRDNQDGQYYNLHDNDVQIHLDPGEYLNRFNIVFQEPETLGENELVIDNIDISFNNNTQTLLINSRGENLDNLKIFNTSGQLIKELPEINTIQKSYSVKNMASGVYILRITTRGSHKAFKFVKS
jgi:hypothetical protein